VPKAMLLRHEELPLVKRAVGLGRSLAARSAHRFDLVLEHFAERHARLRSVRQREEPLRLPKILPHECVPLVRALRRPNHLHEHARAKPISVVVVTDDAPALAKTARLIAPSVAWSACSV